MGRDLCGYAWDVRSSWDIRTSMLFAMTPGPCRRSANRLGGSAAERAQKIREGVEFWANGPERPTGVEPFDETARAEPRNGLRSNGGPTT